MSAKDEVLYALYMEYQKDVPRMHTVTSEKLSISEAAFNFSLEKLYAEGSIENVKINRVKDKSYPLVFYRNVRITTPGINQVEDENDLAQYSNGEEKGKRLLENVKKSGMDRLENIIAKFLAELTKG